MKIKVWLMVLLLALLPLQGWAQEETDYEQIYQGVLEQFYSLLTEGGEELEGIGGAIGVMELTWMFGEAENGLEDIGYCITDVNGDGIEELLIGQTAWERSAYLCAVYTCVDGRAVCALESWARSRFFLMEDGRFYYEGSQGAAQSGAGVYRLEEGMLTCETFCFTDFAPGSMEEVWAYRNETGAWAPEESRVVDMSEFRSLSEQMSARIVPQNYTAFSAYAERSGVRAAWGEDAIRSGMQYLGFAADRSEFECTVVFLCEEAVSDFALLELEFADMSDAGEMFFTAQEVYRLDELTPELPLAVITTFYGDISSMGVSYTEADGTQRAFNVSVSGYDGSLQMVEIQIKD